MGTVPAGAKGHSSLIDWFKGGLQEKAELFRILMEESGENWVFTIEVKKKNKKKPWKWLIIPGRECNKNLHRKVAI